MKYTLNEHKEKKLVTLDLSESVGIVGKIRPESVQKLNESAKGKSNRKLIVQMEAIHVGRTANYTFYTEQGLKDGLESWTHPYNKPVLTHHDAHRGEPIGRILKAEFAESTLSGRKGLIFTCEITDASAVEKVLDGRYSTVSIGATTDKVTCNICGTDRAKEWCEHWKGEEYEGQTCHYTIGKTQGREVSYVNVPADENAGNFSVSIEDGDTNESAYQIFQIAEGLMQNTNLPDINLYESATDDVKQLVDGLLKLDEGSFKKMDDDTENNTNTNVNEAALQTQLNEANTTITNLQAQLTEAQGALATVTVEKTKADSLLAESQAEVTRLTTENANLLEAAHKALAEKVVDMKLALRKADAIAVTREESVEEHIKRSAESLNDAIKDLQAEMTAAKPEPGSIKNPGAGGADNNPANSNEGTEDKVTVSEAMNMFKGMFGRKNK